MTINGTTGDDNLVGTTGNDSFDLTQGGNDTVQGLAGNDAFSFGATFTAADHVDGGDGADTLKLAGDYSAGVTFGAATLVNVETISLADGFSYKLTTNDATVASGQSMTVDGSALTGTNALTFDGSAETNGTLGVRGGLGNDSFTMGAHFTALDRVSGGGGNDTLSLAGNYNIAFGGSTIRDIDTLLLGAGHNYRFTENDNNIAAGANMTLNASAVNGANTIYWNGSHESDGSVTLLAGSGTVSFAGGAQGDTLVMGANLSTDDRIKGEGGADVVSIGGADYNLAMGKPLLEGIQTVTMQGGFDYHITSGGGIAAGATQVWDASALGAADSLSLNFVKETLGSVTVDAGTGATSITGGAKADTFAFTTGFNAATHINGEAGNDRVTLNGDYSAGVTLSNTTLESVEELDAAAGHSYSFTLAAKTIAANASLKVDASALGAANALTVHGEAAGATSTLSLIGGAGNDVLAGGAANDTFDLSHGGNDTATGGAGDDVFNLGAAFTAADAIDGGTGNDTVSLNGDYSAGVTLGAATLVNVETLSFAAGHSYALTTNNATVASGQTLTVDASALAAANGLTFNGAAETDGAFAFTGGAGNDTLTGGALADSFNLSNGGNDTAHGGAGNDTFALGGTLTAADSIDGGADSDTVTLAGNYSAGVTFGAATLTNVETLTLGAGNSYNLTSNDATVASGAILTVDASALGASNALTFNGAAETNGSFAFTGGAGNDVLTSGHEGAVFDLSLGGNDTAGGTSFGNVFEMGGALNSGDRLNGGSNGEVDLNGDYSGSHAITIDDTVLKNISLIKLAAGHSYNITYSGEAGPNAAAFTFDASTLTAADSLTLDFSAVTGITQPIFLAGAGNDHILGAKNAVIDLSKGGEDTANLNGGIAIMGATLDSGDSLTNVGTLSLNGDYSGTHALTITSSMVSGVNGAGATLSFGPDLTRNYNLTVTSASAISTVNEFLTSGSLIFDGSAETTKGYTFDLTADHNTIAGGGGADTVTDHGSLLVFHANGGNDSITETSAFNRSDVIDGGAGNDTLTLDMGADFTDTSLVSVENLRLASVDQTVTTDANLAAGQTMNVSVAGTSTGINFDGSLETDGFFVFTGGTNNDQIFGGELADIFNLTAGGDDFVYGDGGNDTFNFGNTLTANDHIDGGTGNDTVNVSGNTNVTFITTSLTSVENLVLAVGGAYSFTTIDANVAAGATLTVDATALSATDTLHFSGAAETDGAFDFKFAGNFNSANDVLAGGSHTASTVINPAFTATGFASTLELNGDYSAGLTIGASTFSGIGHMVLDAGHSYKLTFNGLTVPTNQGFVVDAHTLGASDVLTFNASAETHGLFYVVGGAGDDVLTGGGDATFFDLSHGGNDTSVGGAGNDTFYNLNGGTINGGAGNDTLLLDDDFSSGYFIGGGLTSIETLAMLESGHAYAITVFDSAFSGGTFAIDGSALTSALNFNGSAETDTHFAVTGGAGNDTLSGGGKSDTFDLTRGGEDSVTGGGGADTVTMGATLDAGDHITGDGNDVVSIGGDYSAGLVMGVHTLLNVGELDLGDGSAYTITFNDGSMSGTGEQLRVVGYGTTVMHMDASAEANSQYDFYAGAGSDVLIGGGGTDFFDLSLNQSGDVSGNDTAQGNGNRDVYQASDNAQDHDTFVYKLVSDSTSTTLDQILSMNFASDTLSVSAIGAVTGVDPHVVGGTLSDGSHFDTQLAAAVGAGQLAAHHAVLFTANAGGDSGHSYVVIDENGTAGYQAGGDLVIEVTGFTGTLSLSNFS